MARIKLALPEAFHFSTDINVRIGDINYGGHLGNDAVLSIIHEARMRFLKSLGFSELDCGGPGLIMSDAAIVFKSESFYGDLISASVGVDEFNPMGCDFFYQLVNKESGKEIARAKTGIVFFDYEKRKPTKVPEAFKKHFEQ
jgi:4-hydroxybenzoyl-CoA thioesterase